MEWALHLSIVPFATYALSLNAKSFSPLMLNPSLKRKEVSKKKLSIIIKHTPVKYFKVTKVQVF